MRPKIRLARLSLLLAVFIGLVVPGIRASGADRVTETGLSTATLAGALYYVDGVHGDDGSPGTIDQPWHTIQHGADIAQPGDTVVIRGGFYYETVVLRRSGIESAPITFRSYPGERVAISSPAWQVFHVEADWLVLDGLVIADAQGGHGIEMSGSSHVLIQNCEVTNNPSVGVYIYSHPSRPTVGNTIRDCRIHHNGREGVYVKVASDSHVVISDNVIERSEIFANGT